MTEPNQPDTKANDATPTVPVDDAKIPPGYIYKWGCIVTGVVSFLRATQENNGIAVAALLLVTVAAFGMAYYISSRRG
jgi:hypothetical protein